MSIASTSASSPPTDPSVGVDPVHTLLRDALAELRRLAVDEPDDQSGRILAGLIEAVLAVLEIHAPGPPQQAEDPRCEHDRLAWPCPTVTAISAALVGQYAEEIVVEHLTHQLLHLEALVPCTWSLPPHLPHPR